MFESDWPTDNPGYPFLFDRKFASEPPAAVLIGRRRRVLLDGYRPGQPVAFDAALATPGTGRRHRLVQLQNGRWIGVRRKFYQQWRLAWTESLPDSLALGPPELFCKRLEHLATR